jgi:hypothetical protein
MIRGEMKKLAKEATVLLRTLQGWRLKLTHDPEWRPYLEHNLHKRVFKQEEEQYLADWLRTNYTKEHKFLGPSMVCAFARKLKARLDSGLDISDDWMMDPDPLEAEITEDGMVDGDEDEDE